MVATSRYGTYGISQALIYAFSVGALKWPGQLAIDIAFAIWDEAFTIIEARAPRVDASDDPDHPYLPPNQDNGDPAPGDLEAGLTLATLGGLAHPSREKKRRAFLAAQLLLDERAAITAPAFKIALGAISDPATLTWLLCILELSNDKSIPVREFVRRSSSRINVTRTHHGSSSCSPLVQRRHLCSFRLTPLMASYSRGAKISFGLLTTETREDQANQPGSINS